MRSLIPFLLILSISGLPQAAETPASNISASGTRADDGDDRQDAMSSFNSFNAAFRAKDYETMLTLTYPPIVEMLGGHDGFVAQMKQIDGKVTFDSTESTQPAERIDAGDSYVYIIPTVVVMTLQGRHARETSFTLAVRKKNEKSWTLIGGSGFRKQPEALSMLLPGFPPSVKLPLNVLEQVDASGAVIGK